MTHAWYGQVSSPIRELQFPNESTPVSLSGNCVAYLECGDIDVGVVLYMCVDRVPVAYIRFTLSRLKNIWFIVYVFNHDIGCSDFSLLVFCVDSVVGQGQTT